MAKLSKSISFKNATIDYDNDLIVEVLKDETKTYRLSSILKDWNNIEGLNLSFKKDDELESEDCDREDDEE